MSIFLTVIVKAKPSHRQEIQTLLYRLPELSKKEDACIEYDVHQSIDDENTFILNEQWKSLEGLEFHNLQAYSKEFSTHLINYRSTPSFINQNNLLEHLQTFRI
ncbi:putative quinol monooxygenase [Sphingobacterium chungjuense]|uniref:putative quinol monooxygenase n=1 Tax=Sphingobacterium chungjuense TaxID=2675553 RepID=UPI00140994C1|nr:putative quinol monooxygenase [Sphingobacterium chungjuense]